MFDEDFEVTHTFEDILIKDEEYTVFKYPSDLFGRPKAFILND